MFTNWLVIQTVSDGRLDSWPGLVTGAPVPKYVSPAALSPKRTSEA